LSATGQCKDQELFIRMAFNRAISQVSPASIALSCSIAGPVLCLQVSPELFLRINVTPAWCLVSPQELASTDADSQPALILALCRPVKRSLCLSLVKELSVPTGLYSSFLHFPTGTRCPLLFMVAAVCPLPPEEAG